MTLQAVVYTRDGVQAYDDVGAAVDAPGETWVHASVDEASDLETIKDRFGLHSLAVEDVLDENTRAKTEEYGDHTFVLVNTTRLSQRDDVAFGKEIHTQSVGLFVGDGWLVTIARPDLELVAPTAPTWTRNSSRVADRGADFLAYRVLDAVVDDYFDVLDEIETDIEAVEERVLTHPEPGILEELNGVRRDLLAFRKVAWPTREAVGTLSRGDSPQVAEANEKYFRDVYDHLVQVVDLIETYRDLTGGSRDIYLNAVSQSTNEVMKTLTVVATIFIPLTFVVGVYGMNFAGTPFSMPELGWTYAYPATMLGMALVAALMLAHFRRQGWL
ncbi:MULTISPECIES: magnesium/cobalt transporter CorA [Halolamina]|uniref:Magnesium transport protein CorA n=1 Tax=Halolamina pelagica TaxID=699431 RepID=A0A1I5RL29_9EURY|nr:MULTISPECIES: magnesium/cobalt transporter CorA [Halolamina]NHX35233.1 magnesium/cobalt transporter CorA [Halolamina sp. R1-12]SFP59047.1 magnesium transporter [Halolamina pelagica]